MDDFIPRLVAESLPVREKEHPLRTVLPQESIDDRHRHAGLPRAGRHDDQRLPVTFIEVLKNPLDVLDALGPIDDTGVDLDQSFRVDPRVLEPEPLKVFLCVEALQLSKRIALPVPEPYLVAVGEEDEDVLTGLPPDVVGILLRLLLPDERVF